MQWTVQQLRSTEVGNPPLISNKQQAVLPLISEGDITSSVQLATLRNAFQRNAQGSHQTASPNNTLSALHAFGWTCILEGYSKLFMTNCQINEKLLLKKLDCYYFIALGSEAMALHSCQAARIHMDIGNNLKYQLFKSACHTHPRSTLSTATLVEEEMRSFQGLAFPTVPASHFSNSCTKNKITTASK